MQVGNSSMKNRFKWVVLILSVIIIIGLYRSVSDLWVKRSIFFERQNVARELQEENEQLKRRLEEVHTPFFVEKEAREKLGMVREGETVVLMDVGKNEEEGRIGRGEEMVPNWKQWWQLFF